MICCYYIDMLLLQSGMTALHSACGGGHTEVVKYLINNNADISATNNVSDYAVCLLYISCTFMLIIIQPSTKKDKNCG